MDVLPLILSEEMVRGIPVGYLKSMANCSTDTVKMKINDYLAKEGASPDVKEVIQSAYEEVFKRDKFFADEEFMCKVQRVGDLTYSSVDWIVKTELLEEWRDVLCRVFQSDFATPYIAPINGTDIERLIFDLNLAGKKDIVLRQFAVNLNQHKSLFRDINAKRSVGTAMKRILLNATKYRIILGGIEFLLNQRAKGQTEPVWRVL